MSKFTLRWGIIGAGWISSQMASDLLIDPSTRDEAEVNHQVVAVAARTLSRAQGFIKDVLKEDPLAKAYGSYDELIADSDVDCVYIGTTNPEHFEPAKKALEAGKNVLCEKPFTVTMKQTETLLALAKRKDVFLMEAVWTRYMPIAKDIERLVRDEKVIGDVRRVYGDLSMDFKIHDLPEGHRMTSVDMAGGGLLDLGPYPLLWTLLTLSGPQAKPPSRVSSNIQFTNLPNVKDQVDAQTCFTLNWDDEGAQAICTTSITSEASNHAVIIQGTKGEIILHRPAYRPTVYTIRTPKEGAPEPAEEGEEPEQEFKRVKKEIVGRGMHWMADDVAKCIRDGKKESARMTHEMTRLGMSILHGVRSQNGLRYPMDDE